LKALLIYGKFSKPRQLSNAKIHNSFWLTASIAAGRLLYLFNIYIKFIYLAGWHT